MNFLKIKSKPLSGEIFVQPSKSMAHRAIISAFLAKGESNIDNIVLSDDIEATLGAVSSLGAKVSVQDSAAFPSRKIIKIISNGLIEIKNPIIDCIESGTTARFLMPITRLTDKTVMITGRGRLIERPFDVYKNLFVNKGLTYIDSEGKMPIELSGKLLPGEYSLPGTISSQFISGLLFSLPLLDGPSTINITGGLESLPYIKMTLQVLKEFGISINHDEDYKTYQIDPNQCYKPQPYYVVEGDWSQAAFFCVIGAISGKIKIKGLKQDSLQGDRVILDILKTMSAKIEASNDGIIVSKSNLISTTIDVSQCPDLVPAIAVAASVATGKSDIINAGRLRIKESDRLLTTYRELNNIGANIIEKTDSLEIIGTGALTGGKASGCGDHRIVMALAAASAVCNEEVAIEGYQAVKKSYPDFWDDFISIGGEFISDE